MSEQIIIPVVLQQTARDILFRLNNLGEVWVGPGVPQRIQDGEQLQWEWDERENVVYTRHNQGSGGYARIPRLELTHIHVPTYGPILRENPEPVGEPVSETRVSLAVDLYPGDSAPLNITNGFTATISELEAVKDAILTSAKLRLGATTTPVGAELTAQLTKEITQQTTDTKATSQSISAGVTVVNKEDKPFRVHLQAERTVQRVRYSAMVDVELDFVVSWFPFQNPRDNQVKAVWGSLEQFYSSMAGLEPSSVGQYGGRRARSLSDVARGNPQERPPRRVTKMPFTVEYDEETFFNVVQVREPIAV